MIIVKLNGGLGNQFFQYALGRRLSEQNNVQLKLDLSVFRDYPLRTYRLNNFNISAEIATDEEIRSLIDTPRPTHYAGINRILKQTGIFKASHIRERSFSFDPRILRSPPNAYLEGYWQTERYFKTIEPILKAEFTVKDEMDSANRELADLITETDSISLHIRRGDYVLNPATNEYHGVCSLHYYQRAINQLSTTVKNPHVFVFSDDPDWVRINLNLPCPSTLVTINGPEKDYDDLRLMSLCDHHILANSSFSWWGAWLCSNPEKQVYAPRRWFQSPEIDTSDLIPESWHRI